MRATICLLTYGDYLPYFRRCFESVYRSTPLSAVELRIGLNAAPRAFEYLLQTLCPGTPAPQPPPGATGVQQYVLNNAQGSRIRLWNSPVNLYKEPMCRLMYHDTPIETEYVVWLDDDSYVEPGWWEALTPLLDRGIDYIGQEWWVYYLPGQAEMIRAQPWYRGVPFDARDGKPGCSFITGGFMAVKADRIREANFPDTGFRWKDDTLKQYGGDTLLGEIARQLGWTRVRHDRCVKVNVDLNGNHPAPRRGGTGRQFGSDIDVVIR